MDSGKYLVINMTVMSPRPKGDSCRQLGSEATSSEPDGPEGRSRWGWDVQDEAARTPRSPPGRPWGEVDPKDNNSGRLASSFFSFSEVTCCDAMVKC